MESLAKKLTDYLIEKNTILEEDYEIYKYGFQIGIEMLICMVTCFGVAIHMNMIGQCIIFFIIFFMLRSYVGGLHMSSFWGCFLCSNLVVFLTLLLIKYISLERNFSIVVSFFEIFIIWVTKPVENINRPVNDLEKKQFGDKIRKNLLIVAIIVFIFLIVGLSNYLNTITYTLGVIIVSMFLGNIKNIVDERSELRRKENFINK